MTENLRRNRLQETGRGAAAGYERVFMGSNFGHDLHALHERDPHGARWDFSTLSVASRRITFTGLNRLMEGRTKPCASSICERCPYRSPATPTPPYRQAG